MAAKKPDETLMPEEELALLDPVTPVTECSAAVANAVADSTNDFMEAPWLKKSS